jgi:hypothetical protein
MQILVWLRVFACILTVLLFERSRGRLNQIVKVDNLIVKSGDTRTRLLGDENLFLYRSGDWNEPDCFGNGCPYS